MLEPMYPVQEDAKVGSMLILAIQHKYNSI